VARRKHGSAAVSVCRRRSYAGRSTVGHEICSTGVPPHGAAVFFDDLEPVRRQRAGAAIGGPADVVRPRRSRRAGFGAGVDALDRAKDSHASASMTWGCGNGAWIVVGARTARVVRQAIAGVRGVVGGASVRVPARVSRAQTTDQSVCRVRRRPRRPVQSGDLRGGGVDVAVHHQADRGKGRMTAGSVCTYRRPSPARPSSSSRIAGLDCNSSARWEQESCRWPAMSTARRPCCRDDGLLLDPRHLIVRRAPGIAAIRSCVRPRSPPHRRIPHFIRSS